MRPLSPKAAYVKLQTLCLALGWESKLANYRTPNMLHDRSKPSLTRYHFSIHEMDALIYVQINPQTNLHPRLFAISLFAIRFRLCTGWQGFMLDRNFKEELRKLRPWAHASNFLTQNGRRKFRRMHPECNGYNWKRIVESGAPYSQESTYERWLQTRIAKTDENELDQR